MKKYMVLGVAFGWGYRKGLDQFIQIASELGDEYQVVLVGTGDQVDKQLPENIISIHRTQNQQELAQIYSAADVFVNPTREENYPTVNMESIACGTPVVTYDTGGSPETFDSSVGEVIPQKIDEHTLEVIREWAGKNLQKECRNYAVKRYSSDDRYQEYLHLYESSLQCRLRAPNKT